MHVWRGGIKKRTWLASTKQHDSMYVYVQHDNMYVYVHMHDHVIEWGHLSSGKQQCIYIYMYVS